MDLYIAAQLEYILGKGKKKMSTKMFRELQVLDEYILQQLRTLAQYFPADIFKKFCLRLWSTILKSIDDLAGPSEDHVTLSLVQISIVELFLQVPVVRTFRIYLMSHRISHITWISLTCRLLIRRGRRRT